MKKLLKSIVLGCSLALATFNSIAAEYSYLRQYVHPIVVTFTPITSPDSTGQPQKPRRMMYGSGSVVVIAPGYALTAAHVVSKNEPGTSRKMVVVLDNDKQMPVSVVKIDTQRDLALLAGDFKCPCAPLAKNEPMLDAQMISVGFPSYLVYRIEFVSVGYAQGATTSGTATTDGGQDPRMLVSTASSAPGSSGGGSFVKEDGVYKLVGIIDAIGASPIEIQSQLPTEIYGLQAMYWIVFSTPIGTVREFLKSTPLESL